MSIGSGLFVKAEEAKKDFGGRDLDDFELLLVQIGGFEGFTGVIVVRGEDDCCASFSCGGDSFRDAFLLPLDETPFSVLAFTDGFEVLVTVTETGDVD